MQQILHQLGDGGDTSFAFIDDVVPWLEVPRGEQTLEQSLRRFEAMDDPRSFKTRCTFEQMPGTDVARIVVAMRDPRDCCVSFYHHTLILRDAVRAQGGFASPTSFDAFCEG